MTTGAPVPRLLHPLIDQREGGVDGTTLAPLQQLISLPQEKESHQCRSSFKYLRPPNLMSLSNSTALQLPRLLLPHQIHCLSSAAGCRISAKAKEPPQIPLLQSQSASLPIAHRLELLRYDFTTGLDNRPVFFRTPMILRLPPSAFASFVPQEQSFSSKSSRNLKQSAPIMMREVSVQVEKLSGPEQQTALMEEGSHAKPQQPFAASIGPSVDKSIQCSSSEEQMAKEEQKTSLSDIKDHPQGIPVLQPQSLAPVAESAVSLNGADEAPLDLMLQNLLQETMSTTPVRTCVAPEPLGPSPVQLLTPQSSVFAPLTGPPPVSSPLFQFPPMCPKESIPPVAATATVGVSTSPEIQLGGLPTSNEPSQQPEQPEDYQMLESRLAAIDRVAEKIEQEYERNKELLQTFLCLHSPTINKTNPVESESSGGDANAQKSAEGHSVTPEEASHYDGPSSSPLPMEGALGEETKEDEGTAVPAGSLRLLKSVLEARNQSRLSSAPTSARFSSRLSATAPSKGRQSARRTTYTRDLTHQGPLRRELQYRLAERRRKEAKDYATKILAELENRSENRTPSFNPRSASTLGSRQLKTTNNTNHSSRQQGLNHAPSSSRSLSAPNKSELDARTLSRTMAKQSKLTAHSPRWPESARSPRRIRLEQEVDEPQSLISDWSGDEMVKRILRGSSPSGKTSPSRVLGTTDSLLKGFRDSATPNSSVFIDWDKIDELIESG